MNTSTKVLGTIGITGILAIVAALGVTLDRVIETRSETFNFCFEKDMEYTNNVASTTEPTREDKLNSFRSCAWILGESYRISVPYYEEIN